MKRYTLVADLSIFQIMPFLRLKVSWCQCLYVSTQISSYIHTLCLKWNPPTQLTHPSHQIQSSQKIFSEQPLWGSQNQSANILCDSRTSCRLADFGLAKESDVLQTVNGTRLYMAPTLIPAMIPAMGDYSRCKMQSQKPVVVFFKISIFITNFAPTTTTTATRV